MTRAHWRYILLDQGAVASVVNVLLNGMIAWFSFRGTDSIPLWGAQSLGGDVLVTSFLLPFITCLIVTLVARGDVRRGRLSALDPAGSPLARLPHGGRRRAALFGLTCVAAVSPLVLGTLAAMGIESMPFRTFVIFKSTFAGVLAALVTPAIALAALYDQPAPRA